MILPFSRSCVGRAAPAWAILVVLASPMIGCAGGAGGDVAESSGADLSVPAGASAATLAAGSLCGHFQDNGPDVVTGRCASGLTCSRAGHVGVDNSMSCEGLARVGGPCGEQAGGSHGSDLYTAICPNGTACDYDDETGASSGMSCRFPGVLAAGAKCGENTGHGGELTFGTCAAGLECGFVATEAISLFCR